MKPLRYIYIVVSVLVYLTNVNAQVPGYLGKRIAIGYAPSIMPFNSGYKATDGTSLGTYTPNIKHRIDLNYVVGPKATLSFDYSYQQWGVISNIGDDGKLTSMASSEAKTNTFREFNLNDFKYAYTTSNKFAISIISSIGGIAPRGNYFSFGLSYEVMNPKMVDIEGKTVELGSLSDYGATLRFGKRRIFFDKIMLDAALSLEANTSLFTSISSYSQERRSYGSDYNNQGLLKNDLNKAVLHQAALHTIVSLRLGIYYLL